MKKIVLGLIIVMGVFIFAGCGGSGSGAISTQTEGEKCASMIPDPDKYFKDANLTTELDGRCYYYVTDYQDGEYDVYVQAIKDEGNFPVIHYESSSDTGKMFLAYTSDKDYYLSVIISYDNQGITIECHKVEEESSSEE